MARRSPNPFILCPLIHLSIESASLITKVIVSGTLTPVYRINFSQWKLYISPAKVMNFLLKQTLI